MLRIFAEANYDFIALRRAAYIISAVVIIPGLALLATGLNYSIEFTGGTLVQVTALRDVSIGEMRSALDQAQLAGAEITTFGSDREFVVRTRLAAADVGAAGEQAAQAAAERVVTALETAFGEDSFRVERVEAVGPKVGAELRVKALTAILLSFVVVLVYLAFRFEWRFGLAAVLATAHDILATIAFIRYLDLEVSLVVVSAILTTVGYSLNDTIVIFDRVRENLHKFKRENLTGILNRSINETLPRTIITGGTALVTLIAVLLFAGAVIRPFAWVMIFGIVVGTFSSIYVASPVLLLIEQQWPGKDVRGVKAQVVAAGSPSPGRPPREKTASSAPTA